MKTWRRRKLQKTIEAEENAKRNGGVILSRCDSRSCSLSAVSSVRRMASSRRRGWHVLLWLAGNVQLAASWRGL